MSDSLPWADDEPDAAWTDEYAWTRFRGPDPIPCPADWVFNDADAMAYGWERYPEYGEGRETTNDVVEHLAPDDDDEYNEGRAESAWLSGEVIDSDRRTQSETVEWSLTIGGATVFRRVDPEHDDLFAATAKALSNVSAGESTDFIAPESGRLPDDLREKQRDEQRANENHGLEDF